mmetsp:Transcript_12010/g.30740  ORF Transcript_12010/g.30740 Transcript_12010/m.30740 type:complete len:254 (-) Transcript_12010:176-937(-)|eukprot:jgi/Tetstr1/453683/TSEL_040639.t1
MSWSSLCSRPPSCVRRGPSPAPAGRISRAAPSALPRRPCSGLPSQPLASRVARAPRGRALSASALFAGLPFGANSGGAAAKREALKAELLELCRAVKRGVIANDEDKAAIEALAKKLEGMNPNKKPLDTELPTGKWLLEYTTSVSILGLDKPAFIRPWGPIYQSLDVGSLRASNQETWPLFNEVYAELTPENKSKVKVQFKKFKICGLIPITAPENAKGDLDITYIDEDLRISRGNRGNLFVLTLDSKTPVLG